MFNDFLFSINATLPVFAVMVLGFLLRKAGFLTEGFCKTANALIFKLCLPVMLLRQMAQMRPADLVDGGFLTYAFCGTLVTVLAFWLLSRKVLRDKRLVGAFAQVASAAIPPCWVQCFWRASAAAVPMHR